MSSESVNNHLPPSYEQSQIEYTASQNPPSYDQSQIEYAIAMLRSNKDIDNSLNMLFTFCKQSESYKRSFLTDAHYKESIDQLDALKFSITYYVEGSIDSKANIHADSYPALLNRIVQLAEHIFFGVKTDVPNDEDRRRIENRVRTISVPVNILFNNINRSSTTTTGSSSTGDNKDAKEEKKS